MKPKKSLGQNFLKDREVLLKIIKFADLKADDLVLEIGPGEGILTEELAKHTEKVFAIEVDSVLAKKLDSRFRGNDKIKIINDDILKINLPNLVESYKLQDTSYNLIANIPYYITSPIIQLFLETKYPPREMILMVQKEVAERICSSPGKMSILSVSVQYYAQPELLFYVDKKAFWPVPEVDSAAIRITPFPSPVPTYSSGHPLPKGEEEIKTKNFFRIVRAGFCAKRKMLANNLANSLHLDKTIIEDRLRSIGISPTVRAQELSVDEWKSLANLF